MAKNDTHKITSELVEAYAHCERKAFLLLQGKIEGQEHEYSQILKERSTANRLRFEASPENASKIVIDEASDTQHVVGSDDLIADCDISPKSELYLATGTYGIYKGENTTIPAVTGDFCPAAKFTRMQAG